MNKEWLECLTAQKIFIDFELKELMLYATGNHLQSSLFYISIVFGKKHFLLSLQQEQRISRKDGLDLKTRQIKFQMETPGLKVQVRIEMWQTSNITMMGEWLKKEKVFFT